MQPAPNHLNLSTVAERRARETKGRSVAEQHHPEMNARRPAAPLTRRERRVKQILLKELDRLNGKSWGSGLSYVEKQHLDKTLDAAFIDRELAKMYTTWRRVPLWSWITAMLIGASCALALFEGWRSGTLLSLDLLMIAIMPAIGGTSIIMGRRALQRKIWIYEALRELSDADEIDVMLDRVVQEADALIQRIVDRELQTETAQPAQLAMRRERA